MKQTLLLASFLALGTWAQAQNSAFSIKPALPQTGQEITITYNPAGTALADASSITALAYLYDGNKPKVQEIQLYKKNNGWEGWFTPAAGIDGALLQFRADENNENNGGYGYSVLVHNAKKQPVADALHGLAAAYIEWGTVVGITHDPKKGLQLLDQEVSQYPHQARAIINTKLNGLAAAYQGEEKRQQIAAELEAFTQLKGLSGKELRMLAQFYQVIGNTEKASDYTSRAKVMDPKVGTENERLAAFNQEKNADARIAMGLVFLKDFPIHTEVPSVVASMATLYAKKQKWTEFENLLKQYPSANMYEIYTSAAWALYETGQNAQKAKELAWKGYQLALKEVNEPSGAKDNLLTSADWRTKREYALGEVADVCGAIMLKEGDKATATKYLAKAYESTRGLNPGINERYAQVLAASPNKAEAQKTIEAIVASGNGTSRVKQSLKQLFVSLGNSETGFDAYWSKVEAPARDKMKTALQKSSL
ncbi:hypothetical protein GU926_11855 [Nibribacter ruber]|uniref:Tetratricopeptide repeat protein n=1 Tax=Nibribacter ruber TaxID=2698458 RepID=A0A6P1NWL6_9BACT|nr:hypothetical protein [Nibribacter ruber]QHL88087.1 hypothetical protein GU926_11855 [Nibribacter ruber]